MRNASDPINNIGLTLTEQAKGIRALIMIFAELGFCLVMPLLRKNLGQRYFSPFLISLMFGFAFAACYAMQVDMKALTAYLGLIACMSAYHLMVIARRNAREELWHTYYDGDLRIAPLAKYLPGGKNYWVLEGLYEPLVVFNIGLVLQLYVDIGLGCVFIFSSFWMLFRSRYRYWLDLQRRLDERDAWIESHYALEALNGKPPEETAGLVVKNASRMKKSDKLAIAKRSLNDTDFAKLSE